MNQELTEEDALNYIISYLREGKTGPYSTHGYGFYLSNIAHTYAQEVLHHPPNSGEAARFARHSSPVFYAAGWELARRGVIRPGVTVHGEQVTERANGGDGYTVTPRGRAWLDAAHSEYSPMDPGRFATMLASLGARFGPGFHERSHEALRCYRNLAYVACCAMCGAAAESILLATAIARTGDEEQVLRTYESRSGRSAVENMIVGQRSKPIQEEFRADLNLLKYWRDAAAHGQASNISETEAHTSLALLLRFTQFVNNHWAELTARSSS